MIFSGVWCRLFIAVLTSIPPWWGSGSHSGWISSGGPGHRAASIPSHDRGLAQRAQGDPVRVTVSITPLNNLAPGALAGGEHARSPPRLTAAAQPLSGVAPLGHVGADPERAGWAVRQGLLAAPYDWELWRLHLQLAVGRGPAALARARKEAEAVLGDDASSLTE